MRSDTSSSRPGDEPLSEDPARAYRALTGALLLALGAGCLVGIAVPAGMGWDFANFYDTGRRVAAGQIGDLYDSLSWIAGEPPQGRMRFWGSPISAWLYWPLSFFSAETALVLFKVENTIAYLAGLGLLYLHLRRFAAPSAVAQWRFAATYAFLALIYQPFWTVYRVGGQSSPTVFLLVCMALLAYTAARWAAAATLLVLAVLIKPAFVPLVVLLVLVSGLRFLIFTAGAFAVAGVLSLSALGWEIHRQFLALMVEGLGKTRYGWYNSSLYSVIQNFELLDASRASAGALDPVVTAVKALVLASFGYLVFRARSAALSDAARRHFHFLVSLCFFLLLSGILWEHYLSVLFLMLAYVVACHRYFRREAKWLIGGMFLFALGQNVVVIDLVRSSLTLDSFPAILVLGIFKSGLLILLLVFLWRHRPEWLRSYGAEAWRAS
ncbi:MAG: glycosyltransferase 87 family protein [Candidatus Binatia bacterium]